LANLKSLRSFRYTLTFARTEPPVVGGTFQGTVILPDTLEQTGNWIDQPGFYVVARGNQEYIRDTSRFPPSDSPEIREVSPNWTVQARGEEADFFAQFDRALARDSFQPVSGTEFSFVPNVPFLDPFMNKKLSGRIKLATMPANGEGAKSNVLLPVEVSIASSDKTASWQVKLSGFNQVPPIHFPFVPRYRAILLVDSIAGADTAILRRRLAAHGLDARFHPQGDTLVLLLERDLRDDLLRLLLQPGKAEVWIGRKYLGTGPIPPEARKAAIPKDTTLHMVLEQALLGRSDFQTTALEETAAAAVVRLTLRKDAERRISKLDKLEKSGMYLALTFDQGIVALARIVKRGKSNLLELTSVLGVPHPSVLKTILDSPVLTGHFRLLALEPVPGK
jgi:hypothetical protein